MVLSVVVGPWKTNCYIYSSAKKECIIIDPGGDDAQIAASVDLLNMVPVGIALTHGHIDHVAGLAALREGYLTRGYALPVGIGAADRRYLGSGAIDMHRENLESVGMDGASFLGVDPAAFPRADVSLRDGDRVFGMELVVLETPGHTPGSVCLYGEGEGVLFTGDTIDFQGIKATGLPGFNEKKLRESIQKKLVDLPPETRIYPGHGPATTVEREKRTNPWFAPAAPARPVPAAPRPGGAMVTGFPALSALASGAPRRAASPGAKAAVKAAVKAATRKVGKPAAKKAARKAPPKPARKAAAGKAGARRGKKSSAAVKKSAVAAKKPAARAAAKGKKAGARPARLPSRKIPRQAAAKARPQASRSTKAPGKGRKAAR